MNFLLHFLLAHFLADYPLQSSALVQLKMKRFLGVFIHGFIHLLTMLVIMAPLLGQVKVWVAIAVIYFTHNLIDQTKVKLDKENPNKARFFYFLDQFLHWSIILGMSYYVNDVTPALSGAALSLYLNPVLWLYILILVLGTYFYDVTRYFVLLNNKKGPFYRDYKAMLIHAGVITVAFGAYWLLS